mmetsp:Transcript_87499/g.252650  ORF Transcript_87499/g.252650 Transcript_87499/m.252650 type:complete len:260 (-) Transcript_87499:658-1437(-)
MLTAWSEPIGEANVFVASSTPFTKPFKAPSTIGFACSALAPAPKASQTPSARSLKRSLAKRTNNCATTGSEPKSCKPLPTRRRRSLIRWRKPRCARRCLISESPGTSACSPGPPKGWERRTRPLPTKREETVISPAKSNGSFTKLQAIGFSAATTSSKASAVGIAMVSPKPASTKALTKGSAPRMATALAKSPRRFRQTKLMTRRPSMRKSVATLRVFFAALIATSPALLMTLPVMRRWASAQAMAAMRKSLMPAFKSR